MGQNPSWAMHAISFSVQEASWWKVLVEGKHIAIQTLKNKQIKWVTSLCSFALSWDKNSPENSVKIINHHPFHPALPPTSFPLFSPLCFWYLTQPLNHAPFFKNIRLSTSFLIWLIILLDLIDGLDLEKHAHCQIVPPVKSCGKNIWHEVFQKSV